jgi:hypothetical protein
MPKSVVKSRISKKDDKAKNYKPITVVIKKKSATIKTAANKEVSSAKITKERKAVTTKPKKDGGLQKNAIVIMGKKQQPEDNYNSVTNELQNKNVILKAISTIAPKAQILIELTKSYEKIQEVLDWYETKQKGLIETPELIIDGKISHGDHSSRTFRVNTNIMKEFDKFGTKRKQFRTQDLISLALLEFIEKYKKS